MSISPDISPKRYVVMQMSTMIYMIPPFSFLFFRMNYNPGAGSKVGLLNPRLTLNSEQISQLLVYKLGNISSEIMSGSVEALFSEVLKQTNEQKYTN